MLIKMTTKENIRIKRSQCHDNQLFSVKFTPERTINEKKFSYRSIHIVLKVGFYAIATR